MDSSATGTMNLQMKLDGALNDVLKSSGYIFEIINNNKQQSNLITGPNNQLISPLITSQLASNVAKFDDILDETVAKFDDVRWCIEQMLESRQEQEELKLKEEMERQKKAKEEEERRRLAEEEKKRQEELERKRKEEAEVTAKARRDAEEKSSAERAKAEDAKRAQEEQARRAKEEQERRAKEEQERRANEEKLDFNDFISPGGFDFNMNDMQKGDLDIPNPADILSSINYTDDNGTNKNINVNNANDDLDMNNLLGNDELLLNMSIGDQDFNNDGGQMVNDDDFDVDNFLNQFGS